MVGLIALAPTQVVPVGGGMVELPVRRKSTPLALALSSRSAKSLLRMGSAGRPASMPPPNIANACDATS
jgi:hypothetical protein